MWKPTISCLLIVLLATVTASASQEQTVSGPLTGRVTWQGSMRLTETVTVARDAVLTVSAGSVIRFDKAQAVLRVLGSLRVLGTAESPVVFEGVDGWQGIEFVDSKSGSRIEQAVFAGAACAIGSRSSDFDLLDSEFRGGGTAVKLLRQSSPRIEGCRFEAGEIGIDVEMKSVPQISGSRFTGYRRAAILGSHNSAGRVEQNLFHSNERGISLLRNFPGTIAGNRFVNNSVGIHCDQTQNSPVIQGNVFVDNRTALVNLSFSMPTVEGNEFVDNGSAVVNDQLGSPKLVGNLFRNNGQAVRNLRRSDPLLKKNLFEKNDVAIFCDYASYPQIKKNNFSDNGLAVKLGAFQSADRERRTGSAVSEQKRRHGRLGQFAPLLPEPAASPGVIDVSDNWWGADTGLLAAAGAEGNVTIFFDRFDQSPDGENTDPLEAYLLDRVVYEPWLETPVTGAGSRQ